MTYVQGTVRNEEINISIENKAEDGYNTALHIMAPRGTELLGMRALTGVRHTSWPPEAQGSLA